MNYEEFYKDMVRLASELKIIARERDENAHNSPYPKYFQERLMGESIAYFDCADWIESLIVYYKKGDTQD